MQAVIYEVPIDSLTTRSQLQNPFKYFCIIFEM